MAIHHRLFSIYLSMLASCHIAHADAPIAMEIPTPGQSVRFTNCERAQCAPRPHAKQTYTCDGALKVDEPRAAQLRLSCGDLGSVQFLITGSVNKTMTNGSISLNCYMITDIEFVATASISDVTEHDSNIQCSLSCRDRNDEESKKLFDLCVEVENSVKRTWTIVGTSIAALICFLLFVVFLFHFQYELLFCLRKIKHAWRAEKSTDEVEPQLTLLHSRDQAIGAASLCSEFQRAFSHVVSRSYLEGLAGTEIGDNALNMIRSASILIVIIDLSALEDEMFIHALSLSYEVPSLTRIYVWRTDVMLRQIKNQNMRLAVHLQADTHPIWHRKRYITWPKENVLPRKHLISRLRVILPTWTLFPTRPTS